MDKWIVSGAVSFNGYCKVAPYFVFMQLNLAEDGYLTAEQANVTSHLPARA
jgi:hypothetical protein